MAVICSVYHSTEKFTWVPRSKRFVAEISDFNCGHHMGRVFDDAIDEGFILVSARTGTEVLYVYHWTEEAAGETMGWLCVPYNRKTGRPVREGEPGFGTAVYFFND